MVDVSRSDFGCLLAELMNIQLPPLSIFDRDRENFRFQSRAAANLARLAGHERADPVSRELALRLFVEPLHLRHETFEWSLGRFTSTVTAVTHFNRLTARPEEKRVLKIFGKVGKRKVFVDLEMFHKRVLEITII